MSLYKLNQGKATRVKLDSFKLERDLQTLIENNLGNFFGLEFITTEFQLAGLRIDTLAFDHESNSFVIIEYKRGKSFSVIDQGFAYLSLMLNNKADFILEFNEHSEKSLKKNDIDWSQSRIIFMANSFTTHQQNAINFKDLPIELWEVQRYEGGLLNLNQITASETSESIDKVSKSATVSSVSKEVKKYGVEDHFKEGWESTKAIYDEFTERLFEKYPELIESPRKQYIGFQKDGWVVISISTRKKGLVLTLNRHKPEDLNDPEGNLIYLENSYDYYNQHMSKFRIDSLDDIDYAMMLVRQVYEDFVKENK